MLLVNGKDTKPKEVLTKPAKFRLCSQYRGSQQIEGKSLPTYPATFTIQPYYNRFFPEDNTKKPVRYCEDVQTVDTGTKHGERTKYIPDEIVFLNGELIVGVDQPDLYEFLLYFPTCKSNPLYKDGKVTMKGAPKFELIVKQKISEEKLDQSKLLHDAQNLIFDTKNGLNEEAAKELLKSFGAGGVDELDPATVRMTLLDEAKDNPAKFLEYAQSTQRITRAVVQDAVDYKLIIFQDVGKKWMWGAVSQDVNTDEAIVAVPRGKKPFEYLIYWLQEIDESNVLETMIEETKIAKGQKEVEKV